MNIDWTTILTNVGTSGVLIAALAWLLKTVVSHQLAKDIEFFKRESAFQQIRFSRLHEKRAEVIHDLYKRVIHVRRLCYMLKTDDSGIKPIESSEAFEELFAEILKTNSFFGENALYLSTQVKAKYRFLFTKGITGPLLAVGVLKEIDATKVLKPAWHQQLRSATASLIEKDFSNFDALISDLEAEFQKLLGIEAV